MKESVAAVIFSEDKQSVLVVKRRDVPVWVLPGGAIDPGETPEEAVCREVLEETGLTVQINRKIGKYTPIQVVKTVTHVYECRPIKGTPSITPEIRAIGYYPPGKLPEYFFIVHRTWIQEALEERDEVIDRVLHEVTWFALLRNFLKHPYLALKYAFAKAF